VNVVRRPGLVEQAVGMPEIPAHSAVDASFARLRAFGVQRGLDLGCGVRRRPGELVEGHHVVVRGIERDPARVVSHYEFVPAVREQERQDKGPFFWYWMAFASDDTGTQYNNHNSGGFDPSGDGPSAHGTRDLGGVIPAAATRLVLDFQPPEQSTPPVGCVRG
jgi:hypothetical protein